MLERVMGKRGVVNFDVEFEVLHQIVLAQERYHGCRIKVVLMFGRLHRFWLDEEGTLKSVCSGIIFRHVQKSGKVFLLALHVGIEQGIVPFSSSPENVIKTAQRDRCIECI